MRDIGYCYEKRLNLTILSIEQRTISLVVYKGCGFLHDDNNDIQN